MIYVTGDTHGFKESFDRLKKADFTLTSEDYLIICGDFGFIWKNTDTEQKILDELEQLPFTILWVDGNHENFDVINSFDIEQWNGGKIHRIRKNIFHLMRGQIFVIDGYKIFTMGGAYSLDRYCNLFWEAELPCDAEYKEAVKNLNAHNKEIDIIITHTAPQKMIRKMGYYPDRHDAELTGFLEWIMYECKFKKWYFGHFHKDSEITENITAVMEKVIPIEL